MLKLYGNPGLQVALITSGVRLNAPLYHKNGPHHPEGWCSLRTCGCSIATVTRSAPQVKHRARWTCSPIISRRRAASGGVDGKSSAASRTVAAASVQTADVGKISEGGEGV